MSGLPESFNLVVYLFKGLGQNITPLLEEEIDKIHKERIEKVIELGLQGITSGEVDKSEVARRMKAEEEEEEKKEMMDTVVSELKEHGDIDE